MVGNGIGYQQVDHGLFHRRRGESATQHLHRSTLAIKEDQSGRAGDAVLPGQLLSALLVDIDDDHAELVSVPAPDPIHDGRQLAAEVSAVGAKVEQGRTVRGWSQPKRIDEVAQRYQRCDS